MKIILFSCIDFALIHLKTCAADHNYFVYDLKSFYLLKEASYNTFLQVGICCGRLLSADSSFSNHNKEEYIKEYQFDLIMQTGIKHKLNIEVRASQS